MTKKTILISTIFAAVMMFGLTSIVSAAGDELIFSAETPVPIYLNGTATPSDLVILPVSAANPVRLSQVTTMAVDTDKITLTLGSTSDITFSSALGKTMSVSCADGSTFTSSTGSGFPSTMRVDYNINCTTVVLTIGPGALTEANVAASPLTANTASSYTVTFMTVNALSAGDKIQLDFGTWFTIADSTTAAQVATLTDDSTSITSGIALSSVAATKQIKITLHSTVAAGSVVNIVLDSSLVTNPLTATSDVALSGIDIYTTKSNGSVIDSLADQTAYDRVIDLAAGWNVFAPSQALENSAIATALAPISGSYSAIYTLAWSSSASAMTWQTPTTIDPLYGYAIYNNSGAAIKLPLDFAKETGTNGLYSRNLDHNGWQMVGYVGTSDSKDAEDLGNCLDGLVPNDSNGTYKFSQLVDLTGQTVGDAQTSHAIVSATKSQSAGAATDMKFTKDYGYAINITGVISTAQMILSGDRGL